MELQFNLLNLKKKNIMESGLIIKNKVKVYINITMVLNMRENGYKIKDTDRENTYLVIMINILVNG